MKPACLGLALILAVSWVGCSKKGKKATEVTAQDIARTARDITDAEAQKVAQQLQAAYRVKDGNGYVGLFDFDRMFYRIFPKKVVESKKVLKTMKGGWKIGISRGLAKALELATSEPGFLGVFRDPDGVKIRFRFTEDDGLNYVDMLLDRAHGGEVWIVDFIDYMTGELASDSQRDLIQQSMPELLEGTASKAETSRLSAGFQQLQEVMSLVRTGRYQASLDAYDLLPADLKQQRAIMRVRVVAANSVAVELAEKGQPGGDIYTKAVDDYRRAHPKAVNLDLMLIDYYFFKEDFRNGLVAIDQLDRRVGGDPYLNLFRANLHYSSGNSKEAKKYHLKMLADFPKLPDSYYTLVEISLEDEDYPETTRLLIAMEKNTEDEWDQNFNGEELFEGYRKSGEFTKWRAYLESK